MGRCDSHQGCVIAVARSDGFQYLFPPASFYQRSPTDYEDLRNSKECQGFCGLQEDST